MGRDSRPAVSCDAQRLADARHQDKICCFTRQPADLRARINIRVDEMFRRGLVEETRELLEHGLAQNQTAMQAIGYRQVVEHLRGERPLAETIELVKIRTRQFAKRQLTWFRRQLDPVWIEMKPDESLADAARKINELLLATRITRTGKGKFDRWEI